MLGPPWGCRQPANRVIRAWNRSHDMRFRGSQRLGRLTSLNPRTHTCWSDSCPSHHLHEKLKLEGPTTGQEHHTLWLLKTMRAL